MNDILKIKRLVEELNYYRDKYYNESNPEISDLEYDKLYDELYDLEKKTGFVLSNSPTQSVGYEVKSELKKVVHNHPMLSLDKTKSYDDIVNFLDRRRGLAMLKMDGLTISLRYVDGKLVSAETRGNGEVGEDVLHTVKTFINVPLEIEYKQELVVDGEAIIPYQEFKKINSRLEDSKKYKNPRNLASGSVRQLDSKIAAERKIKFIAWKVVKGLFQTWFSEDLECLKDFGFDIVSYILVDKPPITSEKAELYSLILKESAEQDGYPIDGIVWSYDDVEYGKSLGVTSHHVKSQIAFKFQEEEEASTLRDIEWSMGKTGTLCPVAVFDPVELAGTTVSRASLHNISIMKQLNIAVSSEVTIVKKNEIIPQIISCDSSSPNFKIPTKCPVCGWDTIIKKVNDTEVLCCTNPGCSGKLLGRLSNFVSKQGMDIAGLSESTLEKFIAKGWIHNLYDVFELSRYKVEMSTMDGFGTKSVAKLLDAIERSKRVNLTNFICSLSIPGIGKSQSKILAERFKTWDSFDDNAAAGFDFSEIDGFGKVLNESIHKWFSGMYMIDRVELMTKILTIVSPDRHSNNSLAGLTFAITGSLNHFGNRDELKNKIESYGGKVVGSVSSKTNYLINNDKESNSSKNKKAKELGVKIINENDFMKLLGE